MPTIVATADNAKSQVRLDVDFSDIDAPAVLVKRVDPVTGASTVVRGHGTSVTINGVAYTPMNAGYKAVLYDTEMPLDQAFYYTATAPLTTLNQTSTFSGGYVEPWYGRSPQPSLYVRASLSRSNTWAMSVQSDGTVTVPIVRGEDIPATPGAVFTITANASANVSSSVTAYLEAIDASGTLLATGTTGVVTTLAATTMSASITCPANTVWVRPAVQVNGAPAATVIVSFTSIAITSAAGSATSGGVTVQSLGACQLKDPLQPGNNVRVDFAFDPNPLCTPTEGVFFQSLDVEQRAANSASFNINNQSQPVVVSKTRSSVTSTLTLVSRTFADKTRLNTILHSGSPLLFQIPSEYGTPDRMMSVGATQVSRVLPDHRFPIRVFSLPFASVLAPVGPMQGTVGTRWSDTCNRYASWAAVNTAGLTWIQVLDGLAG